MNLMPLTWGAQFRRYVSAECPCFVTHYTVSMTCIVFASIVLYEFVNRVSAEEEIEGDDAGHERTGTPGDIDSVVFALQDLEEGGESPVLQVSRGSVAPRSTLTEGA
jgi:hypothetical protein